MQTLNHVQIEQVSGGFTFPTQQPIHPIAPLPVLLPPPLIGGPVRPLPF